MSVDDAVAAILKVLPRSSGFYGELTSADAESLLVGLLGEGLIILPREDARRAAAMVPNGYGEWTRPLSERLRDWVWEMERRERAGG